MNVDWLSAVGMLLAGLIVGVMFVYSMRRRDEKSDLERRDLEAKRDTLLAALRAGVDSPAERAKLERETADVLRALDSVEGKRSRPPKAAGQAAGQGQARVPVVHETGRGSSFKGFAWGAGSVLALVGIGWFVTQSAKPKEAMPAQQASAMAPAASTDSALQSLEQSVQKTPSDLELRTELAKAYLDREDMMKTYEQTQYVLERAPKDPRALTYQSIVRIAMGQVDSARQMLDTATKSDPNLIDAWVALAWADTIQGKDAEAQAAIDEAAKRHPDQKERLTALIARMRQDQKATAAKLPANHPAVPPPGSPEPEPQPAPESVAAKPTAPAGSGSIKVTLQLAPGKTLPPNAVIWLMARDAGTSSGPPLAVKRVPPGAFPMTVDFGAADSMMGQPLPAKMRIDARVDSHGNPMVHDPNDPAAAQDGVASGGSITLTLK